MIIAGQKKPGKIRASMGFEAVTSAIQVRCSTNWAMKPHIGSEVNLSPVRSGMMWFMYEIIHLWTAVVDESEVKASSFQLLKLENLLRWSLFTFIYNRSSHMNYFIHISHHFTPHGRYELNKLTSLPMCGFIAKLVEHCTGIAKVTGSNLVEALIFFRLLLSNCLNWTINCDDHYSLLLAVAVRIWWIHSVGRGCNEFSTPPQIYPNHWRSKIS